MSELKRQKIWSGGRTLSRTFKNVPMFQQTDKLSRLIQYSSLTERLISEDLCSAMCELAGTPLSGQPAQLLLSLPHKVTWTLEGLNWHRDIGRGQMQRIPGVQAFVLLDDVPAKGGATLAIAGSQRIKDQSRVRQAISELAAGENTDPVELENATLSIVEMAGRAGDLYLMDMRLLHTPSINASKNVRMMATARYLTG